MNTIIVILVAVAILVVYIAMFWYFIRTIIIMGKKSTLLAVLGFIFSPIAQAIFHISNKAKMSLEDRRDFKRYWLSIIALVIVVIVGGTVLGLVLDPEQLEMMSQFS